MKFILNQQFKKSRTWGKYYVRVFLEVPELTPSLVDYTEEVAWLFWYETKFANQLNSWDCILISHWSWTWVMVISQRLKERFGEATQIIDVSI